MTRSYQAEGIVLKRHALGEGDRIITLFTKEYGKISALAKGVRKINSRRAASLEIGTRTKCYIHRTRSIDIITQTVFLTNFAGNRRSLIRIAQVQQILEIIDLLTIENEPAPEVYSILLSTLKALELPQPQKSNLLSNIQNIIRKLGFSYDKQFTEQELHRYIEEISQQKLRTKAFLIPKTKKIS